jgi:HEAT repeat protein
MKSLKNKSLLVVTLTMLLAMLLSFNMAAQPSSISDLTKNKYALDNLKADINSENIGVRKSAVYFAGKYKILELVDCLVERLENENESSIRLLIAYSLYEIKDAEGMKAVKELSLLDKDAKVKRMSKNLYNAFLENTNITVAL